MADLDGNPKPHCPFTEKNYMTAPTSNSDLIMRKRFGMFLKEARTNVELTQLEVSQLLDYAYSQTISQVERGTMTVPEYDLRLWADALRIDPATFAKKYLYYTAPYVYACLYGKNPYDLESLPHPPKPILGSSKQGASRKG